MTIYNQLTFTDYLTLNETGLEGRAELIDGVLVELPPESGLNLDIATFLQLALIQIGVPFQLVQVGRCEVQTPVLEPKDAANRYPGVVVLRPEHRALARQRMTITLEMPPPQFVMEGDSYREAGRYQGSQRMLSPTFPALNLTVETLFAAGR